jgi:pimeloyl-ACP methyl ester carboxylesterase
MRFVYLHGFASSPASAKAVLFRERLAALGADLEVPDQNLPDFRGLTVSRSLALLEDRIPAGERGVVIGSSFGGYVAGLFATRHPERVAALVLLAPALNLARLLRDRHGEAAVAAWRADGEVLVDHPAHGRQEALGWGFQADAERWGEVAVAPRCPTVVLHGRHDAEVPLAGSERLACGHPHVELVVLDSDHALEDVAERVWAAASALVTPLLRR